MIYIVTETIFGNDDKHDEYIRGVYDNEIMAKEHSDEMNNSYRTNLENRLPVNFEDYKKKFSHLSKSAIQTEDKFLKWKQNRLRNPDGIANFEKYEINKRPD